MTEIEQHLLEEKQQWEEKHKGVEVKFNRHHLDYNLIVRLVYTDRTFVPWCNTECIKKETLISKGYVLNLTHLLDRMYQQIMEYVPEDQKH